MQTRCLANISKIKALQWNSLVPEDAPFVKHEFLATLEDSNCVNAEHGWLPQHIIIEKNEQIIAAMPFYVKGHSYGEYVFDWAWADAYHRHGLEYYPKGLCAIPFTPASCPKLLVNHQFDQADLKNQLISSCLDLANELKLSSIHSLFVNVSEQKSWQNNGFLNRTGFQFHWQNNNYLNFSEYLAEFSSSKRKKIRNERKSVNQGDIQYKTKTGLEISETNWHDFYRFYRNTIRAHGAMAYLNLDFFLKIAESMADQVVMILAYEDKKNIASALFFQGNSSLFGRYWGCDKWIKNLHFELCYYRAIDYCIKTKRSRFEAGAQGEHKLSRGLLPTQTQSCHWLQHPQFYQAIAHHVEDEEQHTEAYLQHLNQHSPFKVARADG